MSVSLDPGRPSALACRVAPEELATAPGTAAALRGAAARIN
jgi:hypothetical protein